MGRRAGRVAARARHPSGRGRPDTADGDAGSGGSGEVRRPRLGAHWGGDIDEDVGRRGAGGALGEHLDLMAQGTSLSCIAGCARGDDVVPAGVAAATLWHHMVNREPTPAAAVLASVAIAGEKGASAHPARLVSRHLHPIDKSDDMRGGEVTRHPANRARRMLKDLCLFLQQKYNGAAQRTHVDRLVRRVQHKDVLGNHLLPTGSVDTLATATMAVSRSCTNQATSHGRYHPARSHPTRWPAGGRACGCPRRR